MPLFDSESELPKKPEWAGFFSAESFQIFTRLVRADLNGRSLPYRTEFGDRVVRLHAEGGEERTLGLLNLAQQCGQCPEDEWTRIIAGHFDLALTAGDKAEQAADHFAADFDAARAVLKVRLYTDDVDRSCMVAQPLIEGAVAALVYDLPDTIQAVHRDHVEAWGRPTEELFEIALENVWAEGRAEEQTIEVEEGTCVTALSGDSFFTASHALMLGHYLIPPPRLGALIGIPHRHTVLYYPIVDSRVVFALNALIPATLGMFQEGPGSISPHIYWWRDGTFTLLPAQITDNTIEFSPPDAFVEEVLDRLD